MFVCAYCGKLLPIDRDFDAEEHCKAVVVNHVLADCRGQDDEEWTVSKGDTPMAYWRA